MKHDGWLWLRLMMCRGLFCSIYSIGSSMGLIIYKKCCKIDRANVITNKRSMHKASYLLHQVLLSLICTRPTRHSRKILSTQIDMMESIHTQAKADWDKTGGFRIRPFPYPFLLRIRSPSAAHPWAQVSRRVFWSCLVEWPESPQRKKVEWPEKLLP